MDTNTENPTETAATAATEWCWSTGNGHSVCGRKTRAGVGTCWTHRPCPKRNEKRPEATNRNPGDPHQFVKVTGKCWWCGETQSKAPKAARSARALHSQRAGGNSQP